jgi:ribonuclease-3
VTPSTTSSPSWAEALTPEPLAALIDRLGHRFSEPGPILLALTHRSWCAENPGEASNERLEFLGDAVLGLVVTDHIFTAHPEMPEGSLAKLRAAVVSAGTLAEVARELGVGEALRLGKGEDASGGRSKASILADAMEAIIGAVYVDAGMGEARRLVLHLFGDHISTEAAGPGGPGGSDKKTILQELAARRFDEAPLYELTDEGPDHEKRFFATVRIGDDVAGRGEGRSKKQAEQAAAGDALGQLERLEERRSTQESERGHA